MESVHELIRRERKAKRVRVSVDVRRGTATATLSRDGTGVRTNTATAGGGNQEIYYAYPPGGPDPEEHNYVLVVTGDANAVLGTGLAADHLVEETSEEPETSETEAGSQG
jgi:hypothetical protein